MGGGRVEGQEVAHFQYYHVPMWRLYLLPLPPPCYTLSGCGLEDAGGGGEESEWNTTEIVDELIDALAK